MRLVQLTLLQALHASLQAELEARSGRSSKSGSRTSTRTGSKPGSQSGCGQQEVVPTQVTAVDQQLRTVGALGSVVSC